MSESAANLLPAARGLVIASVMSFYHANNTIILYTCIIITHTIYFDFKLWWSCLLNNKVRNRRQKTASFLKCLKRAAGYTRLQIFANKLMASEYFFGESSGKPNLQLQNYFTYLKNIFFFISWDTLMQITIW